jgi:sulfopyruvate decarboxylase TPP-binding subunit
MGNPDEVARQITEELAKSQIKLVASLPDNWINKLLDIIEADERFEHIPVNREESAVGLCSGAYMGGMGSAALMGASGFMTLIYALTKINYTYNIPIFMIVTLRGDFNDPQKAPAPSYRRPAPTDRHRRHSRNDPSSFGRADVFAAGAACRPGEEALSIVATE